MADARWKRLIPSIAMCALVVMGAACSEPAPRLEETGVATFAIIGGTAALSPEQAAVVPIGRNVNRLWQLACSGTVIAKRLVLTSRYCVAEVTAERTFKDFPPGTLGVYSGTNAGERAVTSLPPPALGAQVFVPDSAGLLLPVAVILLDRDVEAPVAALRLAAPPQRDEAFTVVGFGFDEKNVLSGVRRERTGLSVLELGANPALELEAGEFLTGESLCLGDEGGPAIAKDSRAVFGFATGFTNGQPFLSFDPSAGCRGAGTRAYFQDLVSVKAVLERAFAAAGATPRLEGGAELPSAKDAGAPDAARDAGASSKSTQAAKIPSQADDYEPPKTNIASSGCSASRAPSTSGAFQFLGLLSVLLALSRTRRSLRP
jgi:hypothetical protein